MRNDTGVYEGFEVSIHYDPMISKLVAWGATRDEAIARMERALAEYVIHGPTTNIEFHRWILRHPRFRAGDFDTRFIQQEFQGLPARGRSSLERVALAAAAIAALKPRLLPAPRAAAVATAHRRRGACRTPRGNAELIEMSPHVHRHARRSRDLDRGRARGIVALPDPSCDGEQFDRRTAGRRRALAA